MTKELDPIVLDVEYPITQYPVIPEGYRWVLAQVGDKGYMCLSVYDMLKVVERANSDVIEWFAGPVRTRFVPDPMPVIEDDADIQIEPPRLDRSNLVSIEVTSQPSEYPALPEGHCVFAESNSRQGYLCLDLAGMQAVYRQANGVPIEWFTGPDPAFQRKEAADGSNDKS